MDLKTAQDRALDAAEDLFYRRGVHAVGMDDIRDTSGVSLKRLYQLFPNKERLVTAYLRRRDVRWRGGLSEYVGRVADPRERLLAVFDWLLTWFTDPDYRGCAWINCFGELGATSSAVAEEVRTHEEGFRRLLRELSAAAGHDDDLAEQLLILAEGTIVTAAITGDAGTAHRARAAAARLVG
ncbi:TetR/AcrR family transcriptional regulator [Actinophytocola glycyrrhizae]|uniref:TetR/AcrR family transcriptional regulator n=1 Tax=Actinophytocola glycyrrhizae TaxID=2044873 RepID=A0ABV9SE26_9PSEU